MEKTLLIVGAMGRMGQKVAQEAKKEGYRVIGVDPAAGETSFPVYPACAAVDVPVDVLVDFSSPQSLPDILAFLTARQIPGVLATTGYDEAALEAIEQASRQVPVFRSANMSIGVAVLTSLARKASEMLGDGFDVEITETHHRMKKDAPSGTALMLYQAIRDAYDTPREAVYGRYGKACPRRDTEIGMHALRGGTVAGEHSVQYLGNMERITLSHSAEDRAVFAVGAVRAAGFLLQCTPGLYDMNAMLGL
ncbi:MAG: 4-hydroxy-tetrahydrodipicolinate reductase [Clostridia bacterium]|nr:4-hydroxy-tetrahydrodipicolinate reductase [Clostridia bacterium]